MIYLLSCIAYTFIYIYYGALEKIYSTIAKNVLCCYILQLYTHTHTHTCVVVQLHIDKSGKTFSPQGQKPSKKAESIPVYIIKALNFYVSFVVRHSKVLHLQSAKHILIYLEIIYRYFAYIYGLIL